MEIILRDGGETIDCSCGYPGQRPEIALTRLSDGHELEAGVTAIVGDEEVARFICRPPLINKLEGIDLNSEG
jgi:hypothetical protein